MSARIWGFTLALLVLCSVIQPQQALEIPDVVKKQVKKMHARCMNSTGVSEELFNEVHTGKLPTDPTFKCFLHCMFDVFGLVDSNNDMHLDYLLEILPPEIHPNIVKLSSACDAKKGVDACDTVYEAVKCYVETDGPFIVDAMNQILG